ncbi:hypothetical protein VTJ49DRAFT_1838 [Mycothermus thermophilus]|uniref:DNA polymerase lambda n=1 Tax=Humicola insolens TaxID=85995 RepID=A0ABR3VBI9_HUMIN
METTLKEKMAIFDQLEAVDHMSDGDDVVDEKEKRHRETCRAFFSSRQKKTPGKRRTTSMPTPLAASHNPGVIVEATPSALNPPTRRASARAGSGSPAPGSIEETPIPDTARPKSRPSGLRRSATAPMPTPSSSALDQSPSASSATRKRKRQTTTKALPESAKIFRGLAFYYIPNNDIAPARKLRIGRAQEYGAQWVRNLADATHVIVDRNLEFKDIQGIVGPDAAGSLTIVNEEYPVDCISFRTLLNPDQARYRVVGRPAADKNLASAGAPPGSSQLSDRSLQIKSPRPPRRRASGGTPPRDVQSSPGSADRSFEGASEPVEDAAPVAAPSRQGEPPNKPPSPPQQQGPKDELSECIKLMQQYKDVPLDLEEDDDDNQSVKEAPEAASDSEADEKSDDERAHKRTTRSQAKGRKKIAFEDRFACNRGGTKDKSADAANPNARTIEVLQKMCDYYDRVNDHWRTTAYRKAITTLRRQTVKITTEEDAYRLPNIGRRLAAKIAEIATTDSLRRLEYAHDEPLDHALQTFLNIYGVGLGRANKWIAQGFRTLDDLRERANLTPNQRIGVDHYEDLNTRIPRAEVTALFEYVRREASALDPAVELLVGGSYRRGADSSGDMDVIVTKKGTTSAAELVPFLEQLIDVLMRKGFLVATLAGLNHHRNNTSRNEPSSKWHGCCVLPPDAPLLDQPNNPSRPPHQTHQTTMTSDTGTRRPVWRRIDFLLVPESEYGAALIYFTGNDIFNRSLRLLAAKKGMRLNQRGLFLRRSDRRAGAKTGTIVTTSSSGAAEGELLEGRDERRIFEILGVKWREPAERWC